MASKVQNNIPEEELELAEKPNIRSQISSVEEKEVNSTPETENVEFDGDIDLTVTRKKRFRINGDNNTVLELNTSDMNIITRLDNLYPKLQKLSQEASLKQLDKSEADTEKALTKISNALVKIDMEMRKLVDEIFDSNVSAVCAPSGSMFDPFNGEFRFEHIIDVISQLYTNNLNSEFKKMSARMKKRTSKYTKGK